MEYQYKGFTIKRNLGHGWRYSVYEGVKWYASSDSLVKAKQQVRTVLSIKVNQPDY